MTLTSILLFTAFAVLFRLLARPAWKVWALYVASILAVYWLQPATPVRYLDFWFPTLTLGLAVLGWVLTQPAPAGPSAGGSGTVPKALYPDENLVPKAHTAPFHGVLAHEVGQNTIKNKSSCLRHGDLRFETARGCPKILFGQPHCLAIPGSRRLRPASIPPG